MAFQKQLAFLSHLSQNDITLPFCFGERTKHFLRASQLGWQAFPGKLDWLAGISRKVRLAGRHFQESSIGWQAFPRKLNGLAGISRKAQLAGRHFQKSSIGWHAGSSQQTPTISIKSFYSIDRIRLHSIKSRENHTK